MRMAITRRVALGAAMAWIPLLAARAADRPKAAAERHLAAIETRLGARVGGRLGVAILDTADGSSLKYRADERFPLCSTFKVLAAAAVLTRVDDGSEQLGHRVPYTARDLDTHYAPVTTAHLAQGAMTIEDLCAAAIEWSDNTAANLLLRTIGGPAGLTRYVRSLDDALTRLDRTEPTLNAATPGDLRDTTSPEAMVRDLRRLLLGRALSATSRRRLETWMVAARTGGKRLRAGVPSTWVVGDKTGSGDHGTTNVVAILRPPARAPILAAVYMTAMPGPAEARDAAHAEIGRLVATVF
jgi:beta-lactamase class A